MDWYYAKDDQQLGPVPQQEFETLVDDGTVTLSTLVWHQGMSDWQPHGEVATPADSPGQAISGQTSCVECGRAFPADEMVHYSGVYVCAECKPIFFQRVQEGVALNPDMEYGGFWIRFVAWLIDIVILAVVQIPILIISFLEAASNPGEVNGLLTMLSLLANYGMPIAYEVFFIGKFGATPGKMALGLKVVRPTGEPITYLRALGRYFAKMLSGLILAIGYIMAAFDEEKRSLHDRICDTRVIRNR